MRFLHTVRSAVYDPAFYTQVRAEGVRSPLMLTWKLMLAGVALALLFFYIVIVIPFSGAHTLDTIVTAFPDDLVVTVAQGEMTINKPQPYYIKNTISKTPENLVVFDGNDVLKGGAADNSTFVLVKKTHVIAAGSNREESTSFSPKAATTTIAKSDVISFVEKVRPYYKPVLLGGGAVMVILGALFISLFWAAFHALYLLLPGLIVFLYGRFRLPQMNYRESYIVAAYASIPVFLFSAIIQLVTLSLPIFIYTLLVTLVALVNLTQVPNEAPHVEDTPLD